MRSWEIFLSVYGTHKFPENSSNFSNKINNCTLMVKRRQKYLPQPNIEKLEIICVSLHINVIFTNTDSWSTCDNDFPETNLEAISQTWKSFLYSYPNAKWCPAGYSSYPILK